MKQELIKKLHASFEEAAYEQDGVEYWLARDLQELLDYSEWRNFLNVVEKAKVACANSGHDSADHFVDINKMVRLGSGAQRAVDDLMLTRYACYLTAQNGDPAKEAIAFAQTYFLPLLASRQQERWNERSDLPLHSAVGVGETPTAAKKGTEK